MNKKNNNRKRKKKGGNKKPLAPVFTPSIDLDVEVPKVVEPNPVCKICGKKIEFITQAVSEGEGEYSHLDCVLEKIRKEENVQPPQVVSYVGRGVFAVVSKNAEGHIVFDKKIQYEKPETFQKFKASIEGNLNEM